MMMHAKNNNNTDDEPLAAGAPMKRQRAIALTEGQATAYFVSSPRIGILAAHALSEPAAASAVARYVAEARKRQPRPAPAAVVVALPPSPAPSASSADAAEADASDYEDVPVDAATPLGRRLMIGAHGVKVERRYMDREWRRLLLLQRAAPKREEAWDYYDDPAAVERHAPRVIAALDAIRAEHRIAKRPLPWRAGLPAGVRRAPTVRAYLAAWRQQQQPDAFLAAGPNDDVSTASDTDADA
jgi:hypothetical protein